jgi:hypothetical protein
VPVVVPGETTAGAVVMAGDGVTGAVVAGIVDGRGIALGAGWLRPGLAVGRGGRPPATEDGNGVLSMRIGAAYPRPEGRAMVMPARTESVSAAIAPIAISLSPRVLGRTIPLICPGGSPVTLGGSSSMRVGRWRLPRR